MKQIITAIFAFALLLLVAVPSSAQNAQKKSGSPDYYLTKALEALNGGKDIARALELLDEQIAETPDNAAALFHRARIYGTGREYVKAFRDLNRALKVNRPRRSGIAGSEIHRLKGRFYYEMEQYDKAAEELDTALSLAVKDSRDDVPDISFEYGMALNKSGRIEEADALFRRALAEDEANQPAMTALARNMIDRGEFADAQAVLLRCIQYGDDYAPAYYHLSRAFDRAGDTEKAIDALIEYGKRDSDAFGADAVELMSKNLDYSSAKVRANINACGDPLDWYSLLAHLYEENRRYVQALETYDRIEEIFGRNKNIFFYKAFSLYMLGLLQEAADCLSQAIAMDGANSDFFFYRGQVYDELGRYDEAAADFTASADLEPDSPYPYHSRAACLRSTGELDKALEDINMSIALESDGAGHYLLRSGIYGSIGKTDLAEKDLEQVLLLDTVADGNSVRHCALQRLGRDGEALSWLERIIESDPENSGSWYDKACLLSLAGSGDDAVAALRKSFEHGFRFFRSAERDGDFDAIRGRDDFKQVIEEMKEAVRLAGERLKARDARDTQEKEDRIIEIPMERRSGGAIEVPCEINGLSLKMILDTGATDVTISTVEAGFMLKNGHLENDDIKGRKYYQIGNGDITEGTVVLLREVKIGEAVLKNVEASVVKNQKAPLLLGQSVLERFGTITIDNINSKLIIKQK